MSDPCVLRRTDERRFRFPAEIRFVDGELRFCAWGEVLRRVPVGDAPGEAYELRGLLGGGLHDLAGRWLLVDVEGRPVAMFERSMTDDTLWHDKAVEAFCRRAGIRVDPLALHLHNPEVDHEVRYAHAQKVKAEFHAQQGCSPAAWRRAGSFPPNDPSLLRRLMPSMLWSVVAGVVASGLGYPFVAAAIVLALVLWGVIGWRRDLARAQRPLP